MADSTSTPPSSGPASPANRDPLLGHSPADLLAAGLATEGPGLAGKGQSTPPPPSPAELAPEFPALEILDLLGQGGMGAVYRARQRALDRVVALKILRPGLDVDPGFARRFEREARALAQLNHPGIVTLYEYGRTPAGRYFILMEFVDGVNLRGLLAAGRLSSREALAIVPPLCDALQYAHDRGVVHCDIKPENILVDRLGRVKIADFGIARLAAAEFGEGARTSPPEFTLTAAGLAAGTPAYMAPEQRAHPAAVDHRADLYALGVVLYQMLTGELPAPGQLEPPSRRVQLDVRIDEIVLRALSSDPARRYAAASELKIELETVSAAQRVAAPSSSRGPSSEALSVPASPVLPSVVFAALACGFCGLIVWGSRSLPSRVAMHFDVAGRADAWTSRSEFLHQMQLFGLGLPLFVAAVFYGLRFLPTWSFNLPHRELWLSPERKQETLAVMLRSGLWLACLVLGLTSGFFVLLVLANRASPPQLPSAGLWALTALLLCAAGFWGVGFYRHFRRAPDAFPAAGPAALKVANTGRAARSPLWCALGAVLVAAGVAAYSVRRDASAISSSAGHPADAPERGSAKTSPTTTVSDRPELRVLLEAAPSSFADINASVRASVARFLPHAKTEEAEGMWRVSSETAGAKQFSFELTRAAAPAGASSPVVKHEADFLDFTSSGYDAESGEGVRVQLRLGKKLPAVFQREVMSRVAYLHLPVLTLSDAGGAPLRAYAESFMDRKDVASLERRSDAGGGTGFSLHLTSGGAFRLNQLSQIALGRRIVFAVGDRVVFAPQVDSEISSDKVEITGRFSEDEAKAILAALSPSPDNEEARVTESARAWLAEVDEGRVAKSWREAAAVFRASVGERQWAESLAAARAPFGAFESRRLIGVQQAATLPGAPVGPHFVFQFESRFAAKPVAIETLTFTREADGVWRMSGYFIR